MSLKHLLSYLVIQKIKSTKQTNLTTQFVKNKQTTWPKSNFYLFISIHNKKQSLRDFVSSHSSIWYTTYI